MAAAGTAIVTGANGFIGSYLVRALINRGWSVHALGRSKRGVSWRERVMTALKVASATNYPPDSNHLYLRKVIAFERAERSKPSQ
jgi:nucleoside-diphosphate-sugar epimerase